MGGYYFFSGGGSFRTLFPLNLNEPQKRSLCPTERTVCLPTNIEGRRPALLRASMQSWQFEKAAAALTRNSLLFCYPIPQFFHFVQKCFVVSPQSGAAFFRFP